jgi:hypothetical protein
MDNIEELIQRCESEFGEAFPGLTQLLSAKEPFLSENG